MGAVSITKTLVESMTPGSVVWDKKVHGFGVRRQLGAPIYFLKVRIEGRQRWLTIGPHGSPWTPAKARKHAQTLLGSVHGGKDPAAVRDGKRRDPSLAQVLDRYFKEYVKVHNRASTAAEIERHIDRDIKPALGTHRIGALGRADIVRWHSGFADRPYAGNRALAYLRKALSLASKDWELRPDNPALGIRMYAEAKRERFFSDDELGRIGAALAAMGAEDEWLPGAIHSVRLLALTGMRLGEVLAMQWEWLDAGRGCLTLPGAAAKAGARVVPLGQAALTYLASLKRVGPFVCYGTDPNAPLSKGSFYVFWCELRARAKLKNARPHDFRHTMGTYSAETGANAFQVRDILGHKTLAMTGRYVERNVNPLRKTADEVAARISSAIDGKSS